MQSQQQLWPFRLIVLAFISVSIALAVRLVGYALTRNVALAMETVHIVFDAVLTLFVLLAIWVTRANFAKKLAYGLFRLEDLLSLFIAVLIAYLGVEFLLEGIRSAPGLSEVAALFELASVVPLFIAGYIKVKAGRYMRSSSLAADGKHTYTDVYEGLGVSIGLLAYGATGVVAFYLLAIAIAFVMLIFTAYSIARDSIFGLLDMPKSAETRDKIIEITKSVSGIRKVKDVRLRWSGPVIFAEIVVEMDPFMTIDEAHPLTEIIESRIKDQVESVNSVTVHVEPVERTEFKILAPVDDKRPDAKISSVLGKSTYFAIAEFTKTRDGPKTKITYVENKFKSKERIGPEFRELLKSNEITDVICNNIGEGIYGLLCAYKVYCWQSADANLETNLKLCADNKLGKVRFEFSQ
ncbi:MAG: cation diffusion facilitator family transporter [Candidatus Micrarchaeia archaeon]